MAKTTPKPTAKDVAEWMFEVFRRDKVIYQENVENVAFHIERKFGKKFVYVRIPLLKRSCAHLRACLR